MPTKVRSLLLSALCLIALAVCQLVVRAQGSSEDWQTFSPKGEEFSVSMPRNPKAEEGQETYHRMTLNTRLYLSQPAVGPVIAVASLSGIKANSAMYTEFQRLNSYVDAFKNWFPQKVRGKDAIAKLTLVGDKTLNGNNGREYKIVIGDLSGTAQMFATRRRFYAVVILNTKKDDVLTERFLSSLTLPEKVITPPTATVTAERQPPADSSSATKQTTKNENTDDSAKTDGSMNSGASATKPGETPPLEKPPGEHGPINGGVLNGKALYLPAPEYPPIAASAKAAGTVMVQILIDESGNVVSAHAVSGHPLLQATSVAAARQARFSPTSLSGVPVKVTGVLTYNFIAP